MNRLVASTLIFVLILLSIVFFADIGAIPQAISSLYAFPYGDLVGHFILMGLLSLLINLSLSCRRVRLVSGSFLLGTMIVLLVVTLEELSQLYFRYRSFSLLDLASSYAGVILFGRLAVLLRRNPSLSAS